MLFARWDQLRTNSARPVGAEAVSGAATEVPRQKFELALSGSATTGRSSLGQQCTVHPEPVRLALLFACPLSGAELDLDLLEFLGELERHLRALSDRFMRSPFLRVGFDHAEQAVSFIGYPGCEVEAFIDEEQSP